MMIIRTLHYRDTIMIIGTLIILLSGHNGDYRDAMIRSGHLPRPGNLFGRAGQELDTPRRLVSINMSFRCQDDH